MAVLNVAVLDSSTIEAAGAVLAAEHAAAMATYPMLPAAYASADGATAALERLLATGHTGVVAIERGQVLAVMTGIARPTHARLPAEGFAMSFECADPTTVLVRLYQELAPMLLAGGALWHVAEHIALPSIDEALWNLGFGRHHLFATRAAAPAGSGDIRVRIADDADLPVIGALAETEIRHRETPPIYDPPLHRSLDEIVERHQALRRAGATHIVADLDGRDVGLLTIERTSPAPRLCEDGQAYIGATATRPEARGRGVGRALVDGALHWAHAHGHRWVSVDFETANPLSRPFWLGAGFRPVGHGLSRIIHADHRPTDR